jgi:predicted transposase YbfD/YdcC
MPWRDRAGTFGATQASTRRSHDKSAGKAARWCRPMRRRRGWCSARRRWPTTLIRVAAKTELKDRCRVKTRYFISSAILDAERTGNIVRGHWLIENALHWTLDVVFGDDQSRFRKGHGAHNMAIVRHFAINLVRVLNDKKPIKLGRKRARWDTRYLKTILGNLSS